MIEGNASHTSQRRSTNVNARGLRLRLAVPASRTAACAATGFAVIYGLSGCAANDTADTLTLPPAPSSIDNAEQSPGAFVGPMGAGIGAGYGDFASILEANVQRVLIEDIGAQEVTDVSCLPDPAKTTMTCDVMIAEQPYLVDVSIDPDSRQLNVGSPRRP